MPHTTVDPLTPLEAESVVRSLEKLPLTEVGSTRWISQHERVERLNIQAHVNAHNNSDEFVMSSIVSHGKLETLVYDLIVAELWRVHVYPELRRCDFANDNTVMPYMVLYHEVTLCNLLETIMYYGETCADASTDALLELCDYCVRQCDALVVLCDKSAMTTHAEEVHAVDPVHARALCDEPTAEEYLKMSAGEQLDTQARQIAYTTAIGALSLLRYLTSHLASTPLTVATRLLRTHDCIACLVRVTDIQPWSCTGSNGKLYKYSDGRWTLAPGVERLKLCKPEAQVWLALVTLLLGEIGQRTYMYSSYKKDQVLRLKGHINDVMLDQLPILSDLQRYLGNLALMDPPAPSSDLIIEQLSSMRSALLEQHRAHWADIAERQLAHVFRLSSEQQQQQAISLSAAYDLDALSGLLPNDPRCCVCGEPAAKRCSQCKQVWYCGRECQVGDWPSHKSACCQ